METVGRWGAVLTVELCAEKVRAGDPDRFLSAMTAPVAGRGALFVLYAFNLEIAKAPWVSTEPMIAQMRLQFWRDVLTEIEAGKPSRAHEVAEPLATMVQAHDLPITKLHQMIDAREWDIERQPFADQAAFESHIRGTAGALMQLSVRALGAEADHAAGDAGYAMGVANWLCAIPALEASGRVPLVDGRADAVRALAQGALAALQRAKTTGASKYAAPALRAGWLAPTILKAAIADPHRVSDGTLYPSEFRRRALLLVNAGFGRW